MNLPVQRPLPPMEARSVDRLPEGPEWQYEPKWDGFRCLVFRDPDAVELQSKSGQPLTRYFPELVEAFLHFKPRQFVLDGEIAVPLGGRLSFDDLLQRIHPAASRVRRLAGEHPAIFIAFDLLVDPMGTSLMDEPLSTRRGALEKFARAQFDHERVRLSPATADPATAREWFSAAGPELDGVVAKKHASRYTPGERTEMVKVKAVRTADCVVGGFRYSSRGRGFGSLLLGLHDDKGLLHHVGFCSSLPRERREGLLEDLEERIEPPGFTGRAPGGPSRWSNRRSDEWKPLRPELVVEVAYDHVTGSRFRHGTRFIRWRPDKRPDQCRMDQIVTDGKGQLVLLGP